MPFSKKIYRYLGKSFLYRFFAFLFFAIILCYMTGAMAFFKGADMRSKGFLLLNKLILLRIPLAIGEFLPFCILFAALSCFLTHARSHEIIIMRTLGLSVWKIIYPVLTIACLIGIFYSTIFDWLAAKAYLINKRQLSSQSGSEKNESVGGFSLSGQGIWLHEKQASGHAIIHIQKFDEKKKIFYNIDVFSFDKFDRLQQHIEAKQGFIQDHAWQLHESIRSVERKAPQNFAHYTLPTILTIQIIQSQFLDPNLISLLRLPHFIRLAKKIGISTKEYEIRFYSLLTFPLFSCLMVMLAATFTLRFIGRLHSMLWYISLAVFISFLLFFTHTLCLTLSRNNFISPFLGVTLSCGIFLPLILGALFHLEDG